MILLDTYPRIVALKLVLRTLSTITECRTSKTDWCLALMLLLMKKALIQRKTEARTGMMKLGQGCSDERWSMIW